ncbi:MAG: hypothetical protein GQ583_08855 [Methyloprofundus sp.]|nr:hypothetical protein [Methyloprofundus sp.]
MSVLVLQIIIKQWDKSQRTAEHVKLRANIPDKYPLISPPAVYAFDQHCVIDQHGDDIQGDRVKYLKGTEGQIKFDRFQINEDNTLEYYGTQSQQTPLRIGSLNNQWIQCKYNCRYSIFESELFYWLYEEVTLNAICVNKLNENLFTQTEPAITYEDFIELDKRKKSSA